LYVVLNSEVVVLAPYHPGWNVTFIVKSLGILLLHMYVHTCPGGVAQWTLHPLQEKEDPGWNPARVKGF
jgi:hypothetical protein